MTLLILLGAFAAGALVLRLLDALIFLPPRQRILWAIQTGWHDASDIGRAACLHRTELYLYLDDLDDAGLIHSEWVPGEPPRCLYHLTETV